MKTSHLQKAAVRLFLVCFTLCILSLYTPTFSQTIPSLFVVVDFMKVEPDNQTKYLEVEQDIWKPMHEERVKQGIIVGWFLYAIEFSGTGDEYNYVAITLYDNSENLENPWKPEIPAQIHPGLTIDNIMEQTYNSRENIKTELFYSIATAPGIPLENPAEYLQVNYMNVDAGKESVYEQLETEIWLPIHNESITTGRTKGWGLWRLLFPRGAGRPYQYITLNTFSEFSYIFENDFSIPFSNIHPDRDFAEITQQTQQARTIVRTELWDLIDYVLR